MKILQKEKTLKNFSEKNWNKMSYKQRQSAVQKLQLLVANDLGIDNAPEIEYYYSDSDGLYGGHVHYENKIKLNTYYFDKGESLWREIVDTVAQECVILFSIGN